MKHYIIFALFVFLFGCNRSSNIDKKTAEKVQQYITDINEICFTDNGELWDFDLIGSIIFVNPENRAVYSTHQGEGLEVYKNIYTGILPENVLIANTATIWNGKKWTMLMLPLPEDSIARNELIIHELFHQHESQIGIDKLQTPDCVHLNERDNRIWMKIEAEALKEALKSNDKTVQLEHIRMAVSARKMRKLFTGEYFIRENNLDLKEGLPQLTGLLLGGRNFDESKAYLLDQLDVFQQNENYMRSFPYVIFPSYGLLMSKESTQWIKSVNSKTDITKLITNYFDLKFTEDFVEMMNLLKERYSGNEFEKHEELREVKQKEITQKYRSKFLESPFVFIKMTPNTNFSFDPNQMFSLEDKGTIYKEFTATDSWGKVKVTDGALINSAYSYIYISAPFTIKDNVAKGKDWEMTLNEGYTILPFEDSNKFHVTRK